MLYKGKALFMTKGFIEKFLILSKGIVVLTVPIDSKDSQNVFCYNISGGLKWRISPSDQLHVNNYYTSIYFSEKNLLQAYNINGIEVTLNEEDGSILKKELIK
jgi:hypothetical protein